MFPPNMNLVKYLKENENEAFRVIFFKYHPVLFQFIYKKTNSNYLAEEITQITFFKLWKYRNSLNEEIPIINQLFRIAKTSLINEFKKEESKEKYSKYLKQTKLNSYDNVLEEVHFKETSSKLEELVDKLPPVRRKVFKLSRFNQLSYKEISERLSISPKTVENHINLAIKYIKPFFNSILYFVLFYF